MARRRGRCMDKKLLLIMAVAKAIVVVLLAGVVAYSVIAGVGLSDGVLQLILAVLGAYFGFGAWVYWRQRQAL